jgi:hypothetical protein
VHDVDVGFAELLVNGTRRVLRRSAEEVAIEEDPVAERAPIDAARFPPPARPGKDR